MMAQTGQPLLGACAFRYVAGGLWLSGGVAACGRGHGCARQNEGDDGNKERMETKGHWGHITYLFKGSAASCFAFAIGSRDPALAIAHLLQYKNK